MVSKKELKKQARKNLKIHYFRSVLLVFICSILLTGGFTYSTRDILNTNFNNANIGGLLGDRFSNSGAIDEILQKSTEDLPTNEDKVNSKPAKYTRGVLSVFVNEITSSGSLGFGILNGINKLVFHDKIASGVIIIIGNGLLFVFNIIFINVLVIGKNRYFLEKRRYYNTNIDKLLFPYKTRETFHLAYILFLKSLYQFLWNLTIVGGIIKYYEYSMIPYVLAENPSISKKDAFKISKQLTSGSKAKIFKVSLSFVGWDILSIFTFRLSSIFYSDIYKESVYAEIYMNLREETLQELNDEDKKLLNDNLLAVDIPTMSSYPEERFENLKPRKLLKIDYDRNYSIQSYIMLFFTFSFIGWLWEVFLFIMEKGTLVNRGALYGPWLPIYGAGRSFDIIFIKKI